jgi:plastocyanin
LCRRAITVALLCLAGAAQARTFVVTANPDLTFTPSTLTIYQHDSVIFKNAGGAHNVRADNDSFWCADDCSQHRAPSAEAWQDTVTFNVVRTLGYYCEAHGDTTSGMRGTIVVIDRVFVDGFEVAPAAVP